jgi:lipopolysaccharide export system protein LptA
MTLGRNIIGMAAGISAVVAGSAVWAALDTRSGAPIDITANQAEVIQSKCLAIWRGAAEALQGDTRLRADTITVYAQPKAAGPDGQASCGGTQKVVAEGNVYYVTPTQHARGDRAVYMADADQIVLTGDVIVVQGKDVARGHKLIINTRTKQSTMESGDDGSSGGPRVRGVFFPEKQTQTTTGAPVAGP